MIRAHNPRVGGVHMRVFEHVDVLILITMAFALGACRGKQAAETTEVPPVSVVAQPPEVGTITTWHRTTGELRSPKESMLSFPGGGKIIEIAVDEGDSVSAGQYLAKVDTSTLAAQYQAARTQVESLDMQATAADVSVDMARTRVEQSRAAYVQAEADYHRFQNLLADGVATQSEFEQVELRYETARLNLDAAEDGVTAARAQADAAHTGIQAARDQTVQISEMIDDGTLRAPYGGRISSRMADLGSVVGPGTPVFRLVGEGDAVDHSLEVVFSLPEDLVCKVSVGMELYLDLRSCEHEIVTTIDTISPEVDKDARNVEIVAKIADDGSMLLPGMFGIIRLPLAVHETAILIPERAILELEDVSIVFIAQGDTAVRREVVTGLREEGKVEILEGITRTDEVIVIGNTFLTDGAKIHRAGQASAQSGQQPSEPEGES